MQHDLVKSLFDLELRSKNEVDLSGSPYILFDSSRRDKHDGTYQVHTYSIAVHINMEKNYSR